MKILDGEIESGWSYNIGDYNYKQLQRCGAPPTKPNCELCICVLTMRSPLSLHEMQPYLAVLGNNNYAKLLVLFLEKMDLSPVTVIITGHASSVICTLNRPSCEILNQLVS